jgi:hypothetical protein
MRALVGSSLGGERGLVRLDDVTEFVLVETNDEDAYVDHVVVAGAHGLECMAEIFKRAAALRREAAVGIPGHEPRKVHRFPRTFFGRDDLGEAVGPAVAQSLGIKVVNRLRY